MMDFGGILGAIGSIAGGFFDRSANAKSAAAVDHFNRNKIGITVKDARKAGIHPLAALGSPIAGSWASPVAAHSMGDAVARGAAQLGGAFGKGKADALLDAQIESERARARNLNADTARTLADAQSRTVAAAARRGGQTLDVANLAAHPIATVGSPVDTSILDKPSKPFVWMRRRIAIDPSFMSNAQDMTDQGGEFVGDVGGAIGTAEAWMRDWLWQDQVNAALYRSGSRSRHFGGSIPLGAP